MEIWAPLMVVSGGLFAGGAATFSWSPVPIWRSMPLAEFGQDFSATIRRTDKVQPALLVAAIASGVGFVLTVDEGSARILSWMGVAGFTATLVASVAVLVPLQRRIIAAAPGQGAAVEEMRSRWFRGHLGRSVLSTLSFLGFALAATA